MTNNQSLNDLYSKYNMVKSAQLLTHLPLALTGAAAGGLGLYGLSEMLKPKPPENIVRRLYKGVSKGGDLLAKGTRELSAFAQQNPATMQALSSIGSQLMSGGSPDYSQMGYNPRISYYR